MQDMLIERIAPLTSVAMDGDVIIADISVGRGFALNSSASSVWNALEVPKTLDQVCAELCETFDVTPEACRPAVVSLIEEWRALGLVRTRD